MNTAWRSFLGAETLIIFLREHQLRVTPQHGCEANFEENILKHPVIIVFCVEGFKTRSID